jgi:uncharacterized protein with HEPN domain
MQPDWATWLWDVRRAGALIGQFLAGFGIDEYVSDALVSSAVERQMTIIGEALNRLSKSDPEVASGITDLGRIVGLRNIIVHGYTSVDKRLVWRLAVDSLPVLMNEVEALLAQQR